MHKTSISFTHRIIEYLNSIAGRYALAVPSRKTAVKLVTGPLSLPEENHPRHISRGVSFVVEPPSTTTNPWKVLQEYFAPVAPWEQHVGDTFYGETRSPYTTAGFLSFISSLTVPTFATGSYHRSRISIISIYPHRLFSRAVVIRGCVNAIPIFSTFPAKGASSCHANRY